MASNKDAFKPTAGGDERIPIKEKVGYGLGQIAGIFQGSITDSLISPVFVLTLGVSPALIGVLNAIYRLWDAVTDLLMGWISDNTRSRWGRRRPYLVLGAVLSGLWLPVMWLLNPHWSLQHLIVWMVCIQLGMFLFATIWNIPYQSLLLEMTQNTHERTNLAVTRQYIATFAWALMPWCWWLAQRPFFGDGGGKPDIIHGALWIATIAGALSIFFGVLPALYCRERYYETASRKQKIPLLKNIKLTFSNRSFLYLMGTSLLFIVGTNAKTGLALYTRVYYVCSGDTQLASLITGYEGTIATVLGLAGIPFFQWLSKRHGKRAAMTTIMSIVTLSSISTFFTYTPSYPYLSMVSGILLAPTASAVWVLLPSMTGDIVDEDELITQFRREGSFAAVFSWVYKLAVSIGATLSGLLVMWAGFDEKLTVPQADSVLTTMRVLLVIVPTAFIAAAIYSSSRYPLTTQRMTEIRTDLEARRGHLH